VSTADGVKDGELELRTRTSCPRSLVNDLCGGSWNRGEDEPDGASGAELDRCDGSECCGGELLDRTLEDGLDRRVGSACLVTELVLLTLTMPVRSDGITVLIDTGLVTLHELFP
jgi:hypothetical protein